MNTLRKRLLHVENLIHHQLIAHSVSVLRIAVGAIFLGFGVLKYFPGVSPAENLTDATTHLLFFGLVPSGVSIVGIATLECFIGASLIANRFMRVAIWLLAVEFVGILSPLVLLPGRLFAGMHNAPTLEGQYVLKDLILVGAAMVIAAGTFRGGHFVRGDLPPVAPAPRDTPMDGEQKLRMVLEGAEHPDLVTALCARNDVSESEFQDWRALARAGAAQALEPRAAPFNGHAMATNV